MQADKDENILLAAGVAMIEKAALWWEQQEKGVATWGQAKEAVLRMYGDRRKRKNSANKLKDFQQRSMTIAKLFREVENLNVYAQLDP